MSHLVLTNPHSVLAAIATRPLDVFEVRVQRGGGNAAWQQVAELARQNGITVRETSVSDGRAGRHEEKRGRAGGAQAQVREHKGVDLEELFRSDEPTGLWLGLDQLQDPHNVGAVFRTAAFFGVRGIVLTRDRSAPLTAAAYDVASGGLEYVPFSEQTSLSRAIEVAKQSGMWVLGTSERATADVANVDAQRKWLVLIGNEERGLRRLSLDSADEVCRIPPCGPIESLNVSVATGVLLATLGRARQGALKPDLPRDTA
jgi:23S rRNA (guanosine2251-2'-O)-methyltransferase